MNNHVSVSTPSEFAEQDMKVCAAVKMILDREYPNHPWCIGVDHRAGIVVIDLTYHKPRHLQKYAYMLHLSSLMAPDNAIKVRRAGGELLERFGIPRDAAQVDTRMRVLTGQYSLDASNPDK